MKPHVVKGLNLLAEVLILGIAILYTSCSSRNRQVSEVDLRQIQKEIGENLEEQDNPTQELLYFVEKRLPSDSAENEHASIRANGRVPPLSRLASTLQLKSIDPPAEIAQSRVGVLPSERYIIAAQHTAAMRGYSTAFATIQPSLLNVIGIAAATNASNILAGTKQPQVAPVTAQPAPGLGTWKALARSRKYSR